mgnify:CR=1 FL=1
MAMYRRMITSRTLGVTVPVIFEAKGDKEAIEDYNQGLDRIKKIQDEEQLPDCIYTGLERIDQEEKTTKLL